MHCKTVTSLFLSRGKFLRILSEASRLRVYDAVPTMRPLTEDESKAVFTKLANYIASFLLFPCAKTLILDIQGKNLVHLIDRPDEPYCFRLQKDRVFYVSEASMRLGISVARPNLVSLGTCFGKFSKSGKFKLHITALDYLAQYAKYKVVIHLYMLILLD